MKNLILLFTLIFTLSSCGDKRESDIDGEFNPGTAVEQPVKAIPSSQVTNQNNQIESSVPFQVQNPNIAPSFILVQQAQHGIVVLNSTTGQYVYTPSNNYVGPDSFTWTISQGNKSATSIVNISVLPANLAPVAQNGNFSLNEDTPLNGNVLATDPNGDNLTFSIVSNPSHGTIVFNANGSFTYTPNLNYNGSDSFTFKANDGQLNSNIAQVSLQINPINDPPQTQNLSLNTQEDTPVNGNLIATDIDSVSLNYFIVGNPSNGTVSLNTSTGFFIYTPSSNFTGTDVFTFRVSDGQLTSNISTVTINVSALNDPPVALPSSFTTPEDVSYNGTLNGVDVDGNSLNFSLVAQATKGTVVITNSALGIFTYVPNLNATGSDSFSFKVNDGILDSNVATVNVQITPVNDAPIAFNSSLSVNPGSSLSAQANASDIDSTNLFYTTLSNPTKGTLVFNSNGSFTYLANTNASGSDSFTFRVNDGQLNSNVATITIFFNQNNQAPVAQNSVFNLTEDTIVNDVLLASDVNGDSLSFSLVTQPTNGSVVVNANGSFTYTPNLNYNGSDSFTFKVNDGQLDSNIATVNLNISPVNDAPVAQNGSFSINEDTVLTGSLIASDIDSNTLSYTIISNPTNGTISLIGNSFTYTPNLNYNGSDSFTFKANDGQLDSNIATISITVIPANDPPVVSNLNLTTLEDTSVSSNFIVQDNDGPSQGNWVIVSQPSKGSVVITNQSTGAFTYTPNLNETGTDSFMFKTSDTLVDSNIGLVTISINPINDAPVAQNGSFSINPGDSYTGNLIASDVDSAALVYSIIGSPNKGVISVNPNTGAFVYTANVLSSGIDSFTFIVNDGQLNSNIATVSINLNLINIAPVALGQSISTNEDSPFVGQLVATDANLDDITYLLVTQPTNGNVVVNTNGSFTYTPNLNYNGSDSFTFKANDGQIDSNIATVFINVLPQNDAPIALSQTFSVSETIVFNNQISATDIDGDNLSYSLLSNTSKGVLTFNVNGTFSYTANLNSTGTDSFTFKANDGQLDSNIATITFVINGVNQPPVANNLNISTNEDVAISSQLLSTDVNIGDTLTYALVSSPSNGNVVVNANGSFTYTPNLNYNGSDSFTFKANDGQTDSNIATVTITVVPQNDAPIAENSSFSIQEDSVYNGVLIASDVDSGTLVFSMVNQATNGSVVVNANGSFTYTPNLNYNGSDSFTFKVNDGQLDSNIATVTITVVPQNDAPIAQSNSFLINEDSALINNVLATDTDSNLINYSLVSNVSNGTLIFNNNGTFTYTPNPNFNGSDSFSFKANDGELDSNVANINIQVIPTNDAPIAQNQTIAMDENSSVSITLVGSDIDGDNLTYSIVGQPSNGTLSGSGSNIIYTPNLNYNGIDSFTFKLNDGQLDSNIATVTLNIAAINSAPEVENLNLITNKNTSVSSNLIASDVDSSVLTYFIVTQPTNGVVSLNSTNGSFTYTPNNNYVGQDFFEFKVSDGVLESNLGTVFVTINNTNQAPTAQNNSFTIVKNNSLNENVTATDLDMDSLTYQVVSQTSNGVLTLNNNGTFVYNPNNNFVGVDSFTFKANDGQLDSNIAIVTINVEEPFCSDEEKIINGDFSQSVISNNSNWQLFSSIPGWEAKWLIENTCGSNSLDNALIEIQKASNDLVSGNYQYVETDSDCNNGSSNRTTNIQLQQKIEAQVGNILRFKFNYKPRRLSPGLMKLKVTFGDREFVFENFTDTSWKLFSQDLEVRTQDLDVDGKILVKIEDLGTPDTFGMFVTNISAKIINCNETILSPSANNLDFYIQEDSLLTNNLEGNDSNNNPLVYSIVSNPANGSLSLNPTGEFTYTPNLNFNGNDSFTYKVNNGNEDSNIATVSVFISPVNDAPVAYDQTISNNGSFSFPITLTGFDIDGDFLSYSIISQPNNGNLSCSNNSCIYSPNTNSSQMDSFTFKVNDGQSDSNLATVSINYSAIQPAGVSPIVECVQAKSNGTYYAWFGYNNSNPFSITENIGTNNQFTTAPSDRGQPILFESGRTVKVFKVNNIPNGNLVWKLGNKTATSNQTQSSCNEGGLNNPPVANSQNLSTNQNTLLNIVLSATDLDGDILNYSIVATTQNGMLNCVGANCTYNPNNNFVGSDSFTFVANDGISNSNIATININIISTNIAPVAQNQSVEVVKGSLNNPIILQASDANGDSLTYTIISAPNQGTLSGTGQNRTYTPNPSFTGIDSFTFRVNDGQSNSNIGTVSINIKDNGGWCDSSFVYGHKLILNNQDQSSDLENFPVMIKLNSNRVNYADLKSNGEDLRFYDKDCNLLAHEIERWNTSGDSFIWVKVPLIKANSNESFIWMNYGKSDANDVQNKHGVWSNGFAGTWHAEESSGNTMFDSTSNNNHMMKFGTPNQNIQGRVAGGELLDSSDDGYVEQIEKPGLRVVNNITLESWAYVTSCSGDDHIIEKYYKNGSKKGRDYALFVNSCKAKLRIGTKYIEWGSPLPLNKWVHIVGKFEGSSNRCTLYVDGVKRVSSTTCSEQLSGLGGYQMTIGNDYPASNVYNGAFDEVRISNVARSDDWIRAQHLSMTDGMVSYGSRRNYGDVWNHVLMTIKSNGDDGKLYQPGNSLYPSGHNGIVYQGSSSGMGIWGYYRFQLPQNISNNANIKKMQLRLYGKNKTSNWINRNLQVGLQNSSNAPVVSSANQFPGGSGGISQLSPVTWGGGNLNWLVEDWNDSPNIKNSLLNLISNQGSLNSGNYIQLWVTRPLDSFTTTTEVGSEDSSFETINHGQLMIEWE